jgi:hypothetical protein
MSVTESSGQAMNLVSQNDNDNWICENRFESAEATIHKGAFVLHNSLRSGGHSAKESIGRE